jgi:hypothetical protein
MRHSLPASTENKIPPRTNSAKLSRVSNYPAGPGFWAGSRKTWVVVIAGICVVAYLISGPQPSNYAPRPSTVTTTVPDPPPMPIRTPNRSSSHRSARTRHCPLGKSSIVSRSGSGWRACNRSHSRCAHSEPQFSGRRLQRPLRELSLSPIGYDGRSFRGRGDTLDSAIAGRRTDKGLALIS